MDLRARRLDDRIRQLCVEAIAAKSSHKVQPILAELQLAIHQYTQRLRDRAAALFTNCSALRQNDASRAVIAGNAPLPNPNAASSQPSLRH